MLAVGSIDCSSTTAPADSGQGSDVQQTIDVAADAAVDTSVDAAFDAATDAVVDAVTDVATDGPAFGCADGGPACPSGMVCCTGEPYPQQGVCHVMCSAVSDRNAKQDFADVNADDVLARLAALRMTAWSYRSDPRTRHLGPMAQDFRSSFGLGNDERRIEFVDANGVTMVAIQALYRRVIELERDNAALRRSLHVAARTRRARPRP
jgi:hypothetical protein